MYASSDTNSLEAYFMPPFCHQTKKQFAINTTLFKLFILLLTSMILSSCASIQAVDEEAQLQTDAQSFEEIVKNITLIPAGESDSMMLKKATDAVNLIQSMELTEASKIINEALQLDVRNSYLHFLNGLFITSAADLVILKNMA